MGTEEERLQTFIEQVLALLEERFPWLGSGGNEPVGEAETIDELSNLYRSLARERDKSRRKDDDRKT